MAERSDARPDGRTASSAQRAYRMLRDRLLRFGFTPNQKINEVVLAGELSISRTPLREALNRLVAEGLLEDRGRGFSVPDLETAKIRDLFEARTEIECSLVRLACDRATEDGLDALDAFLRESMAESPDASVDRLIELDIGFHDGLARLAGNEVLRRTMANLNDRIHLVRWIAMDGRRETTQRQHLEILEAVRRRDREAATEAMREHILHRNEDIVAAIKAAYGHVHTLSSA
ncbi:GntR family transcriptional regulator [Salipiger mucosus]|uniref:Transcriptional regulator, GntR family n=1 Tax=Salipiger mucosus DSM 16094 TaxID=1123237 RepID=S9SH90_9RHOB|nr:GntR family transcriptional regulator [Salipiger mucosus]EPX85639.1 Transcriptional regulator, GntR family [Salipiger mucosus DSM 16094]